MDDDPRVDPPIGPPIRMTMDELHTEVGCYNEYLYPSSLSGGILPGNAIMDELHDGDDHLPYRRAFQITPFLDTPHLLYDTQGSMDMDKVLLLGGCHHTLWGRALERFKKPFTFKYLLDPHQSGPKIHLTLKIGDDATTPLCDHPSNKIGLLSYEGMEFDVSVFWVREHPPNPIDVLKRGVISSLQDLKKGGRAPIVGSRYSAPTPPNAYTCSSPMTKAMGIAFLSNLAVHIQGQEIVPPFLTLQAVGMKSLFYSEDNVAPLLNVIEEMFVRESVEGTLLLLDLGAEIHAFGRKADEEDEEEVGGEEGGGEDGILHTFLSANDTIQWLRQNIMGRDEDDDEVKVVEVEERSEGSMMEEEEDLTSSELDDDDDDEDDEIPLYPIPEERRGITHFPRIRNVSQYPSMLSWEYASSYSTDPLLTLTQECDLIGITPPHCHAPSVSSFKSYQTMDNLFIPMSLSPPFSNLSLSSFGYLSFLGDTTREVVEGWTKEAASFTEEFRRVDNLIINELPRTSVGRRMEITTPSSSLPLTFRLLLNFLFTVEPVVVTPEETVNYMEKLLYALALQVFLALDEGIRDLDEQDLSRLVYAEYLLRETFIRGQHQHLPSNLISSWKLHGLPPFLSVSNEGDYTLLPPLSLRMIIRGMEE
ncbi:MAG TPA: hypothetical protein EYO58_04375, partial [Flavobacteriales bacterium]|nr:hypothetical protein [Flavobacteriales bacterium]